MNTRPGIVRKLFAIGRPKTSAACLGLEMFLDAMVNPAHARTDRGRRDRTPIHLCTMVAHQVRKRRAD